MKRWVGPVGVVCGVLCATAVIFVGPKQTIVCTEARWPNSAFGDMFGHSDGAMFTGCDVPTAAAWVVAVALLLAPVVMAVFLGRSRP
jgi:hypothetical protein